MWTDNDFYTHCFSALSIWEVPGHVANISNMKGVKEGLWNIFVHRRFTATGQRLNGGKYEKYEEAGKRSLDSPVRGERRKMWSQAYICRARYFI